MFWLPRKLDSDIYKVVPLPTRSAPPQISPQLMHSLDPAVFPSNLLPVISKEVAEEV
jgi:hypothetical protein